MHTKCIFCVPNNHSVGKCFEKIRKEKEKSCAAGTSSNKNSDRPDQKCYRCGSEDHMIAKCPKPPRDSEKISKSECSKEKGNRACNNGEDDNDHKIYASMARMSSDDKRENKDYGNSSQLTNWILDSGATGTRRALKGRKSPNRKDSGTKRNCPSSSPEKPKAKEARTNWANDLRLPTAVYVVP